MSKLTRRKFLQAGSVAAAASVLSGCTLNLQRIEYLESYAEPPEEGLPGEDLWYATTCRQCQAGCGVIVRVSNGRARKVEGNPNHPVNRGKLCARGQAALQELYDPDRLQNPVMQKGGRGSLQFEPILWENGLYELGNSVQSADPAGVAFLAGNLSSHLNEIIRRFTDGLSAPPPVVYSLGDELDGRAALAQASGALFGSPSIPYYDLARAEVVFSFGANFLETWLSPVSQSRNYAAMRRGPLGKRGYLVQFEPRISSTAASADKWVPVRPGTEGLVALALGKLISEARGRQDELYQGVVIAELAEASGVPVEELEHLAQVFAQHEHSLAIAGNGLAGQHNTVPAVAAVQALNAIAGRLGQPGGVFLPKPAAEERPPSTFADVLELIGRMKAGQVSILLIHGCNPVFELPPAAGFVEALQNVPLVVYFGSAVDETAVQSDMILPDHTNLEGWGYHLPTGADRPAISGQQPVMRPLYDTRAAADVLLALGKRLGLSSALPWDNEVDYLEAVTAQFGASWAEWRRQGGWWADSDAHEPDLATPAAALKPIPVALPVFAGEPYQYPYHLHIYPSIALGDGRGANKAWLQETPDPMTTAAWQSWIEVNPETAHQLGLHDDDVVRVVSPADEIEAIVYTYHGIPQDVVAMAVGRGHDQYGRFAKDYGSNPIKLLAPAANQETGALAWGATRVQIEKTGKTHPLPRMESPEGVEYLRSGGEAH